MSSAHSHLYLMKENNDLVSHCRCSSALITFPPQQSCPWCGCGWLFTCIRCRKAFTFARAVAVDESWEAIAHRDLANFAQWEPEPSAVVDHANALRDLHTDVVEGVTYVCLDGVFIPSDAGFVRFDGWHARHSLDFVPQSAALTDSTLIQRILANPEYWTMNALPPPTIH
jgi:hypothetical protein